MKVYRGLDSFTSLQNTIVTNGTFDGVHLGHLKVLKKLTSEAHEKGLTSVVITFWPHPRLVLGDTSSFKLITTIEERIQLLEKSGIDTLLIIPFTKEFSELTSSQYVKQILVDKLGAKKVLVGYDHHFGKDRSGNFQSLQQEGNTYNFDVEQIEREDWQSLGISSTAIREHLTKGSIESVNTLLGRTYTLSGIVVHGNKLGRKIGFPTANIVPTSEFKLLPNEGVYAVKVIVNDTGYLGMLNLGYRPTITSLEEHELKIEAHIFNFNSDIYGENITIQFVTNIRKEQKFESIQALEKQLAKDKEKALELLNSN